MPAKLPVPFGQALLRGRYMGAVADMEAIGTPIDTDLYEAVIEHREAIRLALVTALDEHHVFAGTTFKAEWFANLCASQGILWLRLPSGALDLSKDAFSDMVKVYPALRNVAVLRRSLACLNDVCLEVGSDGRNRTSLRPFTSVTGRNQPSTTGSIFGWPRVWRRLIKPEPGMALAYCDYSQQEYAIAADLSCDPAMMEAYRSGDCYIDFAKRAGAVPADATKASHPVEREIYKVVTLGIQYLMMAQSLSCRLGRHPIEAQRLIDQHRRIYRTFWHWNDAVSAGAALYGSVATALGWSMQVTGATKDRTIRNFLMQATGSDILRLACHEIQAAGVTICAPVHDAVLVEAPVERIEEVVEVTKAAMIRAAGYLLEHLSLRVDAKIIRYPERFTENDAGGPLWNAVFEVLQEKTGRRFDV